MRYHFPTLLRSRNRASPAPVRVTAVSSVAGTVTCAVVFVGLAVFIISRGLLVLLNALV